MPACTRYERTFKNYMVFLVTRTPYLDRMHNASEKTEIKLKNRKRRPTPYREHAKRMMGVRPRRSMHMDVNVTHIPEEQLQTNGNKSMQELGEGTFGHCQVKMYKGYAVCAKYMKDSVLEHHLLAEARILAVVGGHRHIPHCFGVCLAERALIMSLHTVDGAPLNYDQALDKKGFSAKDFLRLLIEIGEALKHIHEQKILHNDIKLNNVTLGKVEGGVVHAHLVDFGKACYSESGKRYILSKAEITTYKKHYPQVAPDLRDGLVQQSQKSDVYAFGRIVKVVVQRKLSREAPLYDQVISASMRYDAAERPDINTVLTFLRKKI